MSDYKQTVLDTIENLFKACEGDLSTYHDMLVASFKDMPDAQPTLYGYNIEHLELIARVLQKEDLPPDRIAEVLTDIGRIVAIVKNEFEETFRKVVVNFYRKNTCLNPNVQMKPSPMDYCSEGRRRKE